MRFKKTPEESLADLLNSDAFDDLVAVRLRLSLANSFEELEEMMEKGYESLPDYRLEDFADHLEYAQSLINVLCWFTYDDGEAERLQLRIYRSWWDSHTMPF